MKQEIVKIMKIIDELGSYFLHNFSTNELQIKLLRQDKEYKVTMLVENLVIAPEALVELKKKLSQKRSPELEDYYWQLTGEIEDHSELNLVSMMCDRIELSYENTTLKLEMLRKF